jgi:hypothetical protein
MSRVFAARDTALERDIIVKVLAPELAHGLSAERFTLEIRTTAALQDPHIVPLLAAGMTGDGLPYYTMPLVRGESLAARLARLGALPASEALVVLRDVARAIAGAHAHGIVHRDIKPANVLLTGGGDAPLSALVADFGIAKALTASAVAGTQAGAALTVAGGTPGTPAYMSPEQATSDSETDHRTDLYSWGVLAYEVLSGQHPFATHHSARALVVAHLTERPTSLAEVKPDIPEAVAEVVMRCLEKDPADRPGSAAELLSVFGSSFQSSESPGRRHISEGELLISEALARRLDRSTLDPRIVGGSLHFMENDGSRDVLLFCVPGLGHDAAEFAPLLEAIPYRALSVTLYGFEPVRSNARVPLAMKAHLGLLHELLRDAAERIRPRIIVLVGFSSGGDMVLRMLAEHDFRTEQDLPRVDGCLPLGANISVETCFVSRLFARLPLARNPRAAGEREDIGALLDDLKRIGQGAADLDEWLNVMTYQTYSLRKFRGDVAALRRLSEDVVQPFEAVAPSSPEVFARWFRGASRRVSVLRCVFEMSPAYEELVPTLKLRNLDEDLLGPIYGDDSLILEPTPDHFALLEPARIARHVEAVLRALPTPSTGDRAGRDGSR